MINLNDSNNEGSIGTMIIREFGTSYDTTKIQRSINLQNRMRDEHLRLCARVKRGEFDGEGFAHRLNSLTERYFGLIGQVVGPEDYQRIFGEPIGTPVRMADPAIARKIDYTKNP